MVLSWKTTKYFYSASARLASGYPGDYFISTMYQTHAGNDKPVPVAMGRIFRAIRQHVKLSVLRSARLPGGSRRHGNCSWVFSRRNRFVSEEEALPT